MKLLKRGAKDKGLIHMVAIAEFHLTKGSIIHSSYPEKATAGSYTEHLADLVLPEGAHLHKEDATYMILRVDDEIMYGMGVFKRLEGEEFTRGAAQASCLVIARQPFFDTFHPFLADGVSRFLDQTKDDKKLLQTLYTTLSTIETNHQVTLWERQHILNVRELQADEFENASLSKLVQQFRTDTMVLWYSLLREERILFCGQPAQAVGNFCLATPLLVAPIRGFTKTICPYLPLTLLSSDLDYYTKPDVSSIYGATNTTLESLTRNYDVMATFSASVCVVHQHGVRVTGKDKHFIKNVINGINDHKGEPWVREQFRRYTEQFLQRMAENKLTEQQKRFLGTGQDSKPFAKTEMYSNYLKACSERTAPVETATKHNVLERLDEIKQTPPVGTQRNMMLKNLDDALENIADIEEVVDAGGISIIAQSLGSSDTTGTKFTLNILASMALIIKGQVAILSENLLPFILDTVQRPQQRQNVKTAACGCLQKISTLFIGAKALVSQNAIDVLTGVVCGGEEDLKFKQYAAGTLLQIYRLLPDSPVKDPRLFMAQLRSPDETYVHVLLQLLDIWGQDISGKVSVPEAVETKVKRLSAMMEKDGVLEVDFNTRTNTTATLQAELIRSPILALQLVEAGALTGLWDNQKVAGNEHQLCWLSYDAISLIADTHAGSQGILRLNIIDQALASPLQGTVDYLFRVLRFFEVACQQPDLGKSFVHCGGVDKLVSFVVRNYNMGMRLLCIPALSALRYLFRFQREEFEAIRKGIAPLSNIPLAQTNENQRAHELNKMVRLLLRLGRITEVEIEQEVLVGEFYQTLNRRCKLLNSLAS